LGVYYNHEGSPVFFLFQGAGIPAQEGDIVMLRSASYDAVIVGAGLNGLATALTMARAGRSVLVVEAAEIPGGCVRSDEGTLPGFLHDTYAAVFPLAMGTPFFSSLPPHAFPVEWITPPVALAHPFDDGTCLTLSRSLDTSAADLGRDAQGYHDYVEPFARRWSALTQDILKPLIHMPKHPGLFLSFGLKGIRSVEQTARSLFRTEKAQALFAGLGTHSIRPPDAPGTAGFALLMGASAHSTGWPMPRGGAEKITDALVTYLQSLHAEIRLMCEVNDFRSLPYSRVLLFDLAPGQILEITRGRLPRRHRLQLRRYRHGPGVCKMDWALDGPIPWTAPGCREAGTLHLGGTAREIALAERQVWQGVHPERPFVICSQPSLFDPSRAPQGRHTAWAYCHVPNGSYQNMGPRIEQQVERFAPGFTKLILSRRVLTARSLQRHNQSLVGGDIAAGANSLRQLFFRPDISCKPYAIGWNRFRICSASSPPGAGVHGMCGYNAARDALQDVWRIKKPEKMNKTQKYNQEDAPKMKEIVCGICGEIIVDPEQNCPYCGAEPNHFVDGETVDRAFLRKLYDQGGATY